MPACFRPPGGSLTSRDDPCGKAWTRFSLPLWVCLSGRSHGSTVHSGPGAPGEGIDHELAEQALARAVGRQAEQCYVRSDVLERRREGMEALGRCPLTSSPVAEDWLLRQRAATPAMSPGEGRQALFGSGGSMGA